MSKLQIEIERILAQMGDDQSFKSDEPFSRSYRISEASLGVSKANNNITITFQNNSFKLLRLLNNLDWYPIEVIKGSEVIPIVINYENGRAYSARNWCCFCETADELAKKLMGTVPEALDQEPIRVPKGIVFEQMALWS